MVWSEANREDSNDPKGQHADLPLGLSSQARTLADSGQDPPVADGQHHEGQQKADAHSEQVEEGNRCFHWVGLITTVIAVIIVMGISKVISM